jgi:hypothetical protein
MFVNIEFYSLGNNKVCNFKMCSVSKTLFPSRISNKFKTKGSVWKELEKTNRIGPLSFS